MKKVLLPISASLLFSFISSAQVLLDSSDYSYPIRSETVDFIKGEKIDSLNTTDSPVRLSFAKGLTLERDSRIGSHKNDRFEGPIFYQFQKELPEDRRLGIKCQIAVPAQGHIDRVEVASGKDFFVSKFKITESDRLEVAASNKSGESIQLNCFVSKTDFNKESEYHDKIGIPLLYTYEKAVAYFQANFDRICYLNGYTMAKFRRIDWSNMDYNCIGKRMVRPSFKDLSDYLISNGIVLLYHKTRILRTQGSR